MPNAISSLVLVSKAPDLRLAACNEPNPFITSGAAMPSFSIQTLSSLNNSGKFFMDFSFCQTFW